MLSATTRRTTAAVVLLTVAAGVTGPTLAAAGPADPAPAHPIRIVADRADRATRPPLPALIAPLPAQNATPVVVTTETATARRRTQTATRPTATRRKATGQTPARRVENLPALPGGDVAAVVAFARSVIGAPYVFGAAGPRAYDCSGLILAAYARIGIRLPHKAALQARAGRGVSAGDIRPGDVLIFYGGGHAGIAIGGGMMIHSSRAGRPVAAVRIPGGLTAVRRLVG